ncbi:MAG: undecaprenyldiphospho-muramoylpentapeptide beta-N-acetylglucosaminyltransferase [Treponemataceae bacterium]
MKIVFTGGGTAGHIFPGLAVVKEIRKLNSLEIKLAWIGSKKESERTWVEENNIDFYSIPTGKLRRYFSLQNVLDFFNVFAGVIKSIFLLLKIKPNLLFSKGGFVAVPPCIAAKILRIPIIIHESDFSPGLTTRITSKFARKIFVSYEETIKMFSPKVQRYCVYTGNPVREKFYTASAKTGKIFLGVQDNAKKILLVMGGSLGAKQINDLVYETIVDLCENFFVVHQLGRENFSQHLEIESRLAEKNPTLLSCYKAFDFIGSEMPDLLAASDIIVSRAGANSLWEIISQHKPSLLIPLSTGSSRGDQIENANFFSSAGCVETLIDDEASPENFLTKLLTILKDSEKLKSMVEACKKILPEPASKKIAKLVIDFLMEVENA